MGMQLVKTIGIAALGLAVGLGGATGALAKGHDQGVADGSPTDPSTLRGGVVASIDVAGVGRDAQGNFLGVADILTGLTYGQDVVLGQVAAGTRSIDPVVAQNGQR
jgi:hypothetical protein